jgi:hypothetical protein
MQSQAIQLFKQNLAEFSYHQGQNGLTPRTLTVHKISSAASLVLQDPCVTIIPCARPQLGDLVVLRVKKGSNGNSLEVGSGRFATVQEDDLIVGVLGERRALKGHVGHMPESLMVGDSLNILNLGGVIGKIAGGFQDVAKATEGIYLGSVVANDQILNIKSGALPIIDDYKSTVPLILVAGTCMHSGKTKAAAELVRQFAKHGYVVAAAKLTGVACMRDTILMEDSGAKATLNFAHCGYPSTVNITDIAPVAKAIIKELVERVAPEVVIIELGDGLIGEYNVESFFHDSQLMAASAGVMLCATDFVGTWGGLEILKQFGSAADAISGSATDSQMAVDFIERKFGTPAANAVTNPEKLFEVMEGKVKQWLLADSP